MRNMRKTKKATRITALVLASMFCFSACGAEQVVQSSESKATEVVQSSESSEVVAKPYWEMLNEVSDTSELPTWEGEILEVTVWEANGSGSANLGGIISDTDVAYKEFERVTGVRFNVEDSFDNGGNNIDAKLPMVVASGDLPTMIHGYGIDAQMAELYENGYLYDLTEYYENGTLDQLTHWFPVEETGRVMYDPYRGSDGAIYTIPSSGGDTDTIVQVWRACGYVPDDYDVDTYSVYSTTPKTATNNNGNAAFMVRDDILEALNLDVLNIEEIRNIYVEKGTFTEEEVYSVNINSREEFWQFLRDIKALIDTGNYVGMDGKPMEVIAGPHTETDNWHWLVTWPALLDGVKMDYFSYLNKNAKNESEVIQWAFSSDYLVEYMKECNQLVREDVIAKDSMIDNMAGYTEKLNNLHYAVTYSEKMEDISEKAGSEIGYSPIWVNVEPNKEMGGFATTSYPIRTAIFKDSLNEEQLDQLMHAFNYMNSIVGMYNAYYGPETAGLFTEDADGNRSFVDEELYNAMVLNQSNPAAQKYGLRSYGAEYMTFNMRPWGAVTGLFRPSVTEASKLARNAKQAKKMFSPGVLPGKSYAENQIWGSVAIEVYGTLSTQVEGLAEFWSARAGFEDQLKRVLAAESDAAFEEQLNNVFKYAEQHGLTAETLKQYNDLFVEGNREALKAAGIIK